MHPHTYTWKHVTTHVHTPTHTQTQIHVDIYKFVYTPAHIHKCIHICWRLFCWYQLSRLWTPVTVKKIHPLSIRLSLFFYVYTYVCVCVCVCARVHRALLRVHSTRLRLHRSFCGYVRLFCGYLSARLWTPSTATRISTVARVPERRWQSWIRWHFQWRCQRYRRQKSRASRRTCPEETCPEPQLKSTWPCLCTHTPTPTLSALSSVETAGHRGERAQ